MPRAVCASSRSLSARIWSKTPRAGGSGAERAPHSQDQVIRLVARSGVMALLLEHLIGSVLFQRFTALLPPPLAGDAPHDLREEGRERYVAWPRPATGQHAVERLVEQVVRIALAQPRRPGARQRQQAQDVRPTQPAEDAANLAEGKMRRLIVHWSPTKPLYRALRRGRAIWESPPKKVGADPSPSPAKANSMARRLR